MFNLAVQLGERSFRSLVYWCLDHENLPTPDWCVDKRKIEFDARTTILRTELEARQRLVLNSEAP
jgi:hypothetical protein